MFVYNTQMFFYILNYIILNLLNRLKIKQRHNIRVAEIVKPIGMY